MIIMDTKTASRRTMQAAKHLGSDLGAIIRIHSDDGLAVWMPSPTTPQPMPSPSQTCRATPARLPSALGDLGVHSHNGKTLEQWEFEVTAGGRVRYAKLARSGLCTRHHATPRTQSEVGDGRRPVRGPVR